MTLGNRENLEYANVELKKFFPDVEMNHVELGGKIADKTILSDSKDILPYLQSALFDEKIVEMHLDNSPDVYLATLRDYPPSDELEEIFEEADKETSDETEEESRNDESVDAYRYGDYLKLCENIVSLPVEPGIGNINLRRSSRVILRMYTTSKTIELGACFHSLVEVAQVPLLSLSFPTIGRVIEEDREFRARVPKKFKLRLRVPATRKRAKFDAVLKDISPSGLGFIVPHKLVKAIPVGAVIKGMLVLDEGETKSNVGILGEIKHVTRMRTATGREYTCGLFLYFDNPTDSAKIGKIVAQVQRAHMREIMEKSDAYGVDLMI